jgi:hypothetical protein
VVRARFARRRFRGSGMKAGQDREVLPVRLQWLPGRQRREGPSVGTRRSAMRDEARKESARRSRGGLRQRRRGRKHRLEQGQSERYARALEQCASPNVLLADEHRSTPYSPRFSRSS